MSSPAPSAGSPGKPDSPSPSGGRLYLQVFANPRIAAMVLLGFASGLPLALSTGTLQAWLTVEGLDLKTIGFFALAGLPYTFKFVWAPLLDRFEPRWRNASRRKGWLLVTQLGLAVACYLMATLNIQTDIHMVAVCAVAIAFLSASQDVVFDAYRNDLLAPEERGAGAAVSVLGYRLAMLVSGGLALILADQWLGWPATYRLMAGLFVLLAIASVFVPRVQSNWQPSSNAASELIGFVAMVAAGGLSYYLMVYVIPWDSWLGPLRSQRFVSLAIDTLTLMAAFIAGLLAARLVGFPSFTDPWDAFFSRKHAFWLLVLIVLYKLGDAFAGALSTTFLIRGVGFSPTEVGSVNKVLGLIATLVGALLGGVWLATRPLYQSLMLFGVLQAVSNFGYWILAVLPKNFALMAAAIGVENLCGGMGTAAFVAFLMTLTDKRFSAAQYALLSALAAVGRVYVGPASGVLVEAFGWPTFYVISVIAALPGLLLLALLRRTINQLSQPDPVEPAVNPTANPAA